MLEKDRVIVFPEQVEPSKDGLPFIKIIEQNLKTAVNNKEVEL
jgi:hypothetical protein